MQSLRPGPPENVISNSTAGISGSHYNVDRAYRWGLQGRCWSPRCFQTLPVTSSSNPSDLRPASSAAMLPEHLCYQCLKWWKGLASAGFDRDGHMGSTSARCDQGARRVQAALELGMGMALVLQRQCDQGAHGYKLYLNKFGEGP